jgi:hypothetical protein
MGIKDDMPLLARHEGVWEGTYRYYDSSGKLVDEHKSRLLCRFPESGPYPYHQTNIYTWADGRTEVREFPAEYRDGRIWWDNELIQGWAAELNLDDKGRSVVLYWQRTGDPDLYLYEMIQMSDDGKKRCRTWHWIRSGELETRTAIEEKMVSRDWRAADEELQKQAA